VAFGRGGANVWVFENSGQENNTVSVDGLERDLLMRLRIEALMADYVHAIDTDRLEDWPEFFTSDGAYRVLTRENHEQGLPLSVISCNGRGMFRDRISALRTANIYEPHVYCHLFGALRLTEVGAGTFRAESNFTVIRTMADGTTSIFACGRCLDTIVEEGAGLKFAERLYILNSQQIDTLLVIPL
jgi:anthranilate 1,2-dioxygenase small subunit